MSHGMSWRDMYEHYMAQAKIFDQKANEARQGMADAKVSRQFLEVNRMRLAAQEMRVKAAGARSTAQVIKATHF